MKRARVWGLTTHRPKIDKETHFFNSSSMSTCSLGNCFWEAATRMRNLEEEEIKLNSPLIQSKIPFEKNKIHSLFGKRIKVAHEVSEADSRPARLAGVGWADALLGRADRLAALLLLLHAVHGLVEVKDNVRAVRDQQALLPPAQPLGDVLLQLLEEAGHVHNDAVAWERKGINAKE